MISALLAGLAGLIETARLAWATSKVGVNAEFDAIVICCWHALPVSRKRARDCCGSLDHAGDLHELQHAPHSVHLVVGFEIRNHSFAVFLQRPKEV